MGISILKPFRKYISILLSVVLILILIFSLPSGNYDKDTEFIIAMSIIIPSHFIISFLVNYWSVRDKGIKYVLWVTFDTILIIGITAAIYHSAGAILKTKDYSEKTKNAIVLSLASISFVSLTFISKFLIKPRLLPVSE